MVLWKEGWRGDMLLRSFASQGRDDIFDDGLKALVDVLPANSDKSSKIVK